MELEGSCMLFNLKYIDICLDSCFCYRNFASYNSISCHNHFISILHFPNLVFYWTNTSWELFILGLCYEKWICILFRLGSSCKQLEFRHGHSLLVAWIKINTIDSILDYGSTISNSYYFWNYYKIRLERSFRVFLPMDFCNLDICWCSNFFIALFVRRSLRLLKNTV